MKICLKCGAQIEDTSVFCSQCGCTDPFGGVQEKENAAYEPKEAQKEAEGAQMGNQQSAQQNPGPDTRYGCGQNPGQGGQYDQNRRQVNYQGYDQNANGYYQYQDPYRNQQQGQNQYQYQYNNQYQNQGRPQYAGPPPYDHTREFELKDIKKNKPYCMLVYLMGFIGIIIALIANMSEKSAYLSFHIRQGLKFTVITVLTLIAMAVLGITIIIPIAGAIWLVVLEVFRIIAFVQVCMDQAKEPPLIRAFPFFE